LLAPPLEDGDEPKNVGQTKEAGLALHAFKLEFTLAVALYNEYLYMYMYSEFTNAPYVCRGAPILNLKLLKGKEHVDSLLLCIYIHTYIRVYNDAW